MSILLMVAYILAFFGSNIFVTEKGWNGFSVLKIHIGSDTEFYSAEYRFVMRDIQQG